MGGKGALNSSVCVCVGVCVSKNWSQRMNIFRALVVSDHIFLHNQTVQWKTKVISSCSFFQYFSLCTSPHGVLQKNWHWLVQSLSHVRLFGTPWLHLARLPCLSLTPAQSNFMSIESVMVTAAMKLKDAPGKESYDQPRQHIKKQRYYFTNKGPSSQSYGFSSGHVWMWELDCEESWVLKNWCFWTVVLEQTLVSPLDCKDIQPVHPKGAQS